MSRVPTRTGLYHFSNRFLHGPTPVRHHHHRSLQTLAFEEIKSSPERPHEFTAFVLHGLLGSGRNWRSFSRSLASYLSPAAWRMVMVDLRNHGKSAEIEGLLPPHNLENAAKDLANLVKAEGWDWPDVVIGHSMGGKIAMQFSQSCANGDYGDNVSLPKQVLFLPWIKPPCCHCSSSGYGLLVISVKFSMVSRYIQTMKLPIWIVLNDACMRNIDFDDISYWIMHVYTVAEQLWVLDSVPGKLIPRDDEGEVEKVLQNLQSLPSEIPSRKWLVDHMLKLGFSKSLSEWIGSNLKKSGEHETWAFNLHGAVQMFNSYSETNYWPLLEQPPNGMEIDIVRAEKSDRWDSDIIQQLERLASRRADETKGKVLVHVLPNAGHWVHVDNPKGLLEMVAPKIATLV